ncbi:RNA-binding protein [Myxococcota bacterium]|nr:RNA-binding protein [Myxococcota bacterium]
MQQTIFVGNLPFSTTEAEIHNLFSQYGTVISVKLIADRETGRPRGFGFVEMEDAEANVAIDALNEMDFNGRPLRVNKAQERAPREDRGGGGGGGFRPPRGDRGGNDRRPPRRF